MQFGKKLARLPPMERPAAPAAPPAPAVTPTSHKPTLDELRDRIARVIARDRAASLPPPRRPTELDLPFVREDKLSGPLDRLLRPTPLGHRVGAIPVWTAKTADPALLALLALDPQLAGCDPTRALYLDTETTGLSGGAGTVPFLVGLGFYDEEAGRFAVEQLLLKGLGDEAPILEHLADRLERASMIVTFNGKSFDMPLLRTRIVLNRVRKLPEPPHLDLLHVARRLHKHRLETCALVSLEERLLGRQRVGDVSGADIAAIYHHYLRSGDEASLAPIIEHNALDVISMFALVGLYGEPLDYGWADGALAPSDISAAAQVVRRGGDLERASAFARASVDRGAGALGHRALADVAKARGDKAVALAEYERALELAREAPQDLAGVAEAVRLELAKLYEHHARSYERAIAVVAEGTAEEPARRAARLERLVKKRDKKPAKAPRTKATAADRLRLSAPHGWSKVRPP